MANAKTPEQKLAAINAYQNAIALAKTVRKALIKAVGPKPVKTIKGHKVGKSGKLTKASKSTKR